MRRAYFLIETDDLHKQQVVASLHNTPGVVAVEAVTGPYSLVAILERPDAKSIAQTDLIDIRAIEGIKQVTTCFAIQAGQ